MWEGHYARPAVPRLSVDAKTKVDLCEDARAWAVWHEAPHRHHARRTDSAGNCASLAPNAVQQHLRLLHVPACQGAQRSAAAFEYAVIDQYHQGALVVLVVTREEHMPQATESLSTRKAACRKLPLCAGKYQPNGQVSPPNRSTRRKTGARA
jgi:hypothetical protein